MAYVTDDQEEVVCPLYLFVLWVAGAKLLIITILVKETVVRGHGVGDSVQLVVPRPMNQMDSLLQPGVQHHYATGTLQSELQFLNLTISNCSLVPLTRGNSVNLNDLYG